MQKLSVLLLAFAALLMVHGGASAKRKQLPATEPAPVVSEAGAAANDASPSLANGAPVPGTAAYAAAPAPGLTGLLDTIFKPQETIVPVAPPPQPQTAGVAGEETPTEASLEASLNDRGAPKAGPMRSLVAKHAAANGVPYALAHAVIMVESKYVARVAHAGNYGLMQIRAQTARGLGFSGSATGLLDAETNLRFGMKYLGMAFKMARGDTCGALMRYQSGVGTTRMSAANRAYCARARGYMAVK